MVKYVKDMEEWRALMETSKTKLVVVDFTASWFVHRPSVGSRCALDISHEACCYKAVGL